MFAKPRAKPSLVPLSKGRKTVSTIEEINFDPSAREDYLTGFHKRKLQRIKRAKEAAEKREREDKLAARKTLRESRKADLEKHVEAVNTILREQHQVVSDSSGDEATNREEQWEGIVEEAPIDHEDEYVDDDRFTTVTVETVDVFKDGLHRIKQDEDAENVVPGFDKSHADGAESSTNREITSGKAKRQWSKEPPKGVKKKKKPFRYESKAERKATRFKERSGNKVKAKARRNA